MYSSVSNIKKHKRLTVEELRSFKGLETLTEEQAMVDIEAIENLSVIIFELFKQQKPNNHEKQNANLKSNEKSIKISETFERAAA